MKPTVTTAEEIITARVGDVRVTAEDTAIVKGRTRPRAICRAGQIIKVV